MISFRRCFQRTPPKQDPEHLTLCGKKVRQPRRAALERDRKRDCRRISCFSGFAVPESGRSEGHQPRPGLNSREIYTGMILLEMMGKTAESPGSNAAGQELRTLLKTVTHNGAARPDPSCVCRRQRPGSRAWLRVGTHALDPSNSRPERASANGFANETGPEEGDTGDARRGLCLVSETRRNAGDVGDARRMAHKPATTSGPFDQTGMLSRVVCSQREPSLMTRTCPFRSILGQDHRP